jgi:5,10-methylenetetrahydromethanopterin reductase
MAAHGSSAEVTFGIAFTGHEPWPVVRERAERLDRAPGVTSAWVFDERFRRDPWVTLGLLAGHTSRLRLGTCVTDALIRHPALTGAAAATLAEASGGRAILGLGAGASGFRALGIERRSPATALRDAIGFLRRFWASEGSFDHEGPAFSFSDDHLHFGPVPEVPIAVAGRGPKILELGGELADEVLVATFTEGPLLDHALACVDRGEARRDPSRPALRRSAWVYASVDPDREAARDAVREGIAVALWGSRPILDELGIALPPALRQLMDSTAYAMTPDVIGRGAALVPDDLVDSCSIAGTAEECASRLRGLAARGFGHIAIWPFPSRGASVDGLVDRLVEEVIPAVGAPIPVSAGRSET